MMQILKNLLKLHQTYCEQLLDTDQSKPGGRLVAEKPALHATTLKKRRCSLAAAEQTPGTQRINSIYIVQKLPNLLARAS